ncbi:putative drug/proton antiporter YHK8 [Glarea lozoyensis 74030]|uniref:Putative drug/proton antiporter YHK8 n=1 Tax=Glarea lozoyensis (strain ATCC 74030 / MF5533) TaxID=1104152 RepID=H0EXY3_GLAL7|nr:putative drug/proton antiporter YHK8 [Glarea lozoyensis 74030]
MSSDDNERGSKAAEAESLDTTTNPENVTGDPEKQQDNKIGHSILVEWDGDSDPLDPRTFSSSRKWFYVAVVSTGSLLVTATSSLYVACYAQIISRFGISQEIANLGLSLYVLGLGLGPLLFSPFSEQLLLPMTIFTGTAFIGPVAGPLIGGFINSFANWRWSFYVLLIWTGVMLACVLLVPETYHPILLSKKAAALRKSTKRQYHSASDKARASKSLSKALATSLYVPFQLLFLDPMVLALSTYTSLLQGILYLFFGAFPLVFVNNHGFNLWQVGLTFLGLLIGNLVACLFNPYWHKNWMGLIAKMKAKHGPEYKPEPELRLPPAMIGSAMVTVSLFWFAWTTYPSVHWIVPIIATIFFSIGLFFVFQGLWTFLMAAYPKYAASAMAVNTTTRCLFAAAFPLFTVQMGFDPNCIFDLSYATIPIYILPVWQDSKSKK